MIKIYVHDADYEEARKVFPDADIETIEAHDMSLVSSLRESTKNFLLNQKNDIVEDMSICLSATLLDYFERI